MQNSKLMGSNGEFIGALMCVLVATGNCSDCQHVF